MSHTLSGSRLHAFHARLDLLCALCRGRPPTMLDVSCGVGDELLALSPLIKLGVGVDVSAPRVQRARLAAMNLHLDNLRFAVGDAVAFQMGKGLPNTFDIVLVRGCLQGPQRTKRVLRAARQRMSQGGRIVVVEPHAYHPVVLWQRLWACGRLATGVTPGCVRRLAQVEGLEQVSFDRLPWGPSEDDVATLAARNIFARTMARLLTAGSGSFALVLRAAR